MVFLFHYDAIQMLNTALNKGNKPPIIADRIEVVELEMGTQPPELEIRDIGDLTVDQFRGIFRLTYNGDAHLVLKTKVQANPLNHKLPDIHQLSGSRGMLAAKQPLVVPMHLRLSHFHLSSYVVLVVSKQKGITIVFKTDPLQNVDINSTFDSIGVIQNFIQREIEGQLRQMFREDLPSIIHRLSQQWVKAKVETPYKKQNQDCLKKSRPPAGVPRPLGMRAAPENSSKPGFFAPPQLDRRISGTASDIYPPPFLRPPLQSSRRPRSTTGISVSRHGSPLSAPPITYANSSTNTLTGGTEPSSFPDLEHFDPTYGLRPEGLPIKPIFKGFSKLLFAPNKGLADLAEELSTVSSSVADEDSDYVSSGSVSDDEDYEGNSYDLVEWGGGTPGTNTTPPEPAVEYEAIPAIGGGTVTRPRVVHAQSQTQSPTIPPGPSTASSSSHSQRAITSVLSRTGSSSNGSQSGVGTPGLISRNPSNPYFPNHLSGLPHIYRQSFSGASTVSGPPRMAYPYGNQSEAGEDHRGYLYPTHEEAIFFQNRGGAVNRHPHPYDLEQHHYHSLGDDTSGYDEDIEDYSNDEQRHPSHPQIAFRSQRRRGQESQDNYLSDYQSQAPTSPTIASSPPRSGPRQPQSSGKRRMSVSSNTTTRTAASGTPPYRPQHPNHSSLSLDPSSLMPSHPDPTKIVLRPSSLNNSIQHLSTLSHSNHTLSPYTRSFEHFAVRSGPPRTHGSSTSTSAGPPASTSANTPSGGAGPAASTVSGSIGRSKGLTTTAGIVGLGAATSRLGKNKGDVVIKARRKRMFRIGGAKKAEDAAAASAATSNEHSLATSEAGEGSIRDDRDWVDSRAQPMMYGGHGSYGQSSGVGPSAGAPDGMPGRGKGRPRQRRRKSSFAASGTDFDEADMDRYFKSMQDAA